MLQIPLRFKQPKTIYALIALILEPALIHSLHDLAFLDSLVPNFSDSYFFIVF